MRFFRRNQDEPRLMACPQCSSLVPADSLECEVCKSDLRELPAETRTFTAKELAESGSPYKR